MLNLAELFCEMNDELRLDFVAIAKNTSQEFVGHMIGKVSDMSPIQEYKYAAEGKQRCVYFMVDDVWYSFAYHTREKVLLLNERRGRQPHHKWRMIVGYKEVVGQ